MAAKRRRAKTYFLMEVQTETMIKELHAYSGLEESVIRNIIAYAKCLVKPGTEEIDDLVFTLQMIKYFGITDKLLLTHMYGVFKGNKLSHMTVSGYARCICTLLTPRRDVQAAYVFKVYDINHDGCINRIEFFHLLKNCIIFTGDFDLEDNFEAIVKIVMSTTNIERDGCITLEEYVHMVKENVVMLQLLGKCLPTDKAAKAFLKLITSGCPVQIQQMFQYERRRVLKEDESEPLNPHYPFKLDLP